MKIFVIGTLHLGLTPHVELKKVLEDISPDQILVELSGDRIIYDTTARGSDEMVYAKEWAEENDIAIGLYDVDCSVLKDSVLKDDVEYKELVNRQVVLLQDSSWKEQNKKNTNIDSELGEIEQELMSKFIDVKKWASREEVMLKNIMELILQDGTVVILTGTMHLDFFENSKLGAELPLRYS